MQLKYDLKDDRILYLNIKHQNEKQLKEWHDNYLKGKDLAIGLINSKPENREFREIISTINNFLNKGAKVSVQLGNFNFIDKKLIEFLFWMLKSREVLDKRVNIE